MHRMAWYSLSRWLLAGLLLALPAVAAAVVQGQEKQEAGADHAAAPAPGGAEEGNEQPSQESHGDAHAEEAPHGDAHDEHGAAHGEHGAAHGGAHHDPTDLSHQNASPSLEDPSELRSDLAIWTFVVFLCLLALLTKFAWGPITEGLERREQGIAAMIEQARLSSEEASKQLEEYQRQLAAAREEAHAIVTQARKDAEGAGERIVAEAQQAAQRERERAVEDISHAKAAALQEITDRSVDLAVLIAGRMMQRQLTPDDRAQLIREALDGLPSQN